MQSGDRRLQTQMIKFDEVSREHRIREPIKMSQDLLSSVELLVSIVILNVLNCGIGKPGLEWEDYNCNQLSRQAFT